jgi:hypothetical protein
MHWELTCFKQSILSLQCSGQTTKVPPFNAKSVFGESVWVHISKVYDQVAAKFQQRVP